MNHLRSYQSAFGMAIRMRPEERRHRETPWRRDSEAAPVGVIRSSRNNISARLLDLRRNSELWDSASRVTDDFSVGRWDKGIAFEEEEEVDDIDFGCEDSDDDE